MESERFITVVAGGHKGLACAVPFDPGERWGLQPTPLWRGRRGYRVEGTLNGIEFESVIVPRARQFFLLISERVELKAQVGAGDEVEICLKPAS